MKYTDKLGLPIWNKPETDVFDIQEFNKGNQTIDDIVVDIFNQMDDLVIGDTKANELYIHQEDFIETLKRNYKPIKLSILPNDISKYNYSIIYDIGNNEAIQYNTLTKTYNSVMDEYILLGDGNYGNLGETDIISSYEHRDSKTGNWIEAYPPIFYTTEVGATMTKTFYGSRLDFYTFGDTRGGIWEFVVDGDTNNKVVLSTYNTTNLAIPPRTICKFDKNGTHTVVATFKGDDPEHTPSDGSGTARGWIYYNDNGNQLNSFYIYKLTNHVESIVKPLFSTSNKEFAMEVRKNGTQNPYHFCPYHDAITSKFIEKPKLYIDGVLKDDFINNELISDVKEFKIIQRLNAINPESNDKLAEITTITTFRDDGTVNIEGKYKALTDLDVKTGYGIMFVFDATFNKRFLTSIGNEYVTTTDKIGTNLYLEKEKDMTTSFISLSDTYKNLALACTFNNPKQTLRQGENGKTDLKHITWLNYRNNTLTKLYQQPYSNTIMKKDEVYRFSGTFLLSKTDNLYDLF